MSDLLKLATDVARLISAVYRLQTGSIFNAVGVIGPYRDFKSDDLGLAASELKGLDAASLKKVEAAFNAALDVPADMKSKVTQGEGYLERGFALAQQAIPVAQEAYALEQKAISLMNEVKTFMGV